MCSFVREQKRGHLSPSLVIVICQFLRHPFGQLLQPTDLAEMITDVHMISQDAACEFICALMGISPFHLAEAVIFESKRTSRSRCIFKNVLSSAKLVYQFRAARSDTLLSPNAGRMRLVDVAAVRPNIESYTSRPVM